MTEQDSANDDGQPYDPATINFYSRTAETYTASGAGGESQHLSAFLEQLRPGAHVLDLGCGGGIDSKAMIAAGHLVDSTDGTAEIAKKAEELLGKSVRVMRFDELDAVNRYDAVWANASLLHVPRRSLPFVLGLVHRSLRAGGLHFASYKGGGIEGRDDNGRYFNYLSRDQLVEAYDKSSPWTIEKIVEYTGGGYQGKTGPWIAVTARKSP